MPIIYQEANIDRAIKQIVLEAFNEHKEKEVQPKKIDVVKEMDRIEHEEFLDEYYPREEAKTT